MQEQMEVISKGLAKPRPTFESFLSVKHAEEYTGLDDDMYDAFEAWLMELDTAEILELAQEWGNSLV